MADNAAVGELEAVALKLGERERAELVRVLLLSLEQVDDQATERVWAEEAERRYQELKAGTAEAIPSDQVLAEARSRLQ